MKPNVAKVADSRFGADPRANLVAEQIGLLSERVAGLETEVATLAVLIRQLVDEREPERTLRTGKAASLLGVTRGTLYRWERCGYVQHAHDLVGEVVWDREELLRVRASMSRESRGRRRATIEYEYKPCPTCKARRRRG